MFPKKGKATEKECTWGHGATDDGDVGGGRITRGLAGRGRTLDLLQAGWKDPDPA